MSALELHNYLDLNVMWDKRGRRQKLVCANSAGATQKAGVMKIPILLQRLVCLFTRTCCQQQLPILKKPGHLISPPSVRLRRYTSDFPLGGIQVSLRGGVENFGDRPLGQLTC